MVRSAPERCLGLFSNLRGARVNANAAHAQPVWAALRDVVKMLSRQPPYIPTILTFSKVDTCSVLEESPYRNLLSSPSDHSCPFANACWCGGKNTA